MTGTDVADRERSRGVLLESGRRAERSFGIAAVSAGVHAALIALAIGATGEAPPAARITIRHAGEHVARVVITPPREAPHDARRAAGAPSSRTAAPPRQAGQPIEPAAHVVLRFDANALPPLSRPAPATLPLAIASAPVADADGFEAGTLLAADGAEPSPELLDGQFTPDYPEALRAEHPDGRVLVRFVVDTAGRVEPSSVRIVMATHRAFAESVRLALPGLRFAPATRGGRKLRVRVEQLFDFHCAC